LKGNSPWPAGVWRAGVWSFNTLLLATNIPILTVRVNHTLRSTASDGVWLGDEAREAPTDRVASDVRGAGGSAGVNRTAGVRIARIRLRTLDQRVWLRPISLKALPALAHGQTLLGNAHGGRVARAGNARVPWWLRWRWFVFWLRWLRLPQTCVSTTVKAAKAPVGTIEVRDANRPAGGEPTRALAVGEGEGSWTGEGRRRMGGLGNNWGWRRGLGLRWWKVFHYYRCWGRWGRNIYYWCRGRWRWRGDILGGGRSGAWRRGTSCWWWGWWRSWTWGRWDREILLRRRQREILLGRRQRDRDRLLQAWLRLALGDTGVCTTIVAAQAMARAVCVPDPRGPAV